MVDNLTRSMRSASAVLLMVLLLGVAAVVARAHEGNPDYRSDVVRVVPATSGLSVRVLDHDDAVELTNRSGQDVVVYGYEGEPYARVLADGRVQVDERSATARMAHDESDTAAAGYELASYEYAHGGEAHEDGDDAKAGPRWTTLDRTGRFAWHDERIRVQGPGLPPQVTDRSQETKVRDWRIPIRVGRQSGAIEGELFWVGEPAASDGFPVAAAVSLVALATVGVAAVVLVRRRRRPDG
jgi:hypothetical protein